MNQIAKGQNVTFSKDGSPPRIKITIGSVAIGFYKIFLKCGVTPSEIGNGASNDKPPKSFAIGKPTKLSGCQLSWQIGIAGDPTDSFTQTVVITQNEKTLAKFAYPTGHGDDLTVDYVTLVGK